jgi:glycosyltransferase involved in cell wall biosynthesis
MAQEAKVRGVRDISSARTLGRRLKAKNLAGLASAQRLPTVSVVIPCYNYARYLGDAVGSVTAQTDVGLEVIVVDDASTDGSQAVAELIAERDERVRLIARSANRGHIFTYNEGLASARGKYVVLLSADDMIAPGSLRRAVDLMESQPSIGFVYGRVRRFADASEVVPATAPARFKMWPGAQWLARRCRRLTNCVISPEVVMRRDIYERIGPYRPDLPHTGDLAMWLLGAAVANVGYVDGPAAGYYRAHESNMHATTFQSGYVDGMLIDLEQRRLAFQVAFEKEGMALRNGQALLDLAMRRLAAEALAAAGRAYTWGLTDEWPVDRFVAYASETWPDYEALPQWQALRRRQRVGVRLAKKNPCFVATEWGLRARATWIKREEARTGA